MRRMLFKQIFFICKSDLLNVFHFDQISGEQTKNFKVAAEYIILRFLPFGKQCQCQWQYSQTRLSKNFNRINKRHVCLFVLLVLKLFLCTLYQYNLNSSVSWPQRLLIICEQAIDHACSHAPIPPPKTMILSQNYG